MKHIFILKDGRHITTDRFVTGPKLTPGYWWNIESTMGSGESVWREVVQPPSMEGTLFGYDEQAFMARQYK
jgi:hypothetical protein